jgi:hypothetical protein
MKKFIVLIIMNFFGYRSLCGVFGLFETPKTDQEIVVEAQQKVYEAEKYFKGIVESYHRYIRASFLEKEHFRVELVRTIKSAQLPIHGIWDSLWSASESFPLQRFSGDVVQNSQSHLKKEVYQKLQARNLCPHAQGLCEKVLAFVEALQRVKEVVDQSPELTYEKADQKIAHLQDRVASQEISLKGAYSEQERLRQAHAECKRRNEKLYEENGKLKQTIYNLRERNQDHTTR